MSLTPKPPPLPTHPARLRRTSLPAFALALLAGVAAGPSARPISPLLYGQNLWLDIASEPPRPGHVQKLWDKVGRSGVRIVRIGGAGYDGRYPADSTLLAWVDSIRGIGAEPLVQVSRKVPDRARRAAGLVRFLNVERKRAVRFWSIGNEPGHREPMTAAEVAGYTREIASAMRDVDPGIRLSMGEMAYFKEEFYRAWLGGDQDVTGRDAKGRHYVDIVAFHAYPHGKAYSRADVVERDGDDLRRTLTTLTSLVDAANRKRGRTGDEALTWALTEFNVTYDNPDYHGVDGIGVPSFLNGQFWAEVFGLGMEFGAFAVIPWCIHEHSPDRLATDFGYLGPDPDFHPRSSYHHLQLMSAHLRGHFVRSRSGRKGVKTVVARSGDTLAVLVMNQAQGDLPGFRVTLGGGAPDTLACDVEAGLAASLPLPLARETSYLLLLDRSGRLLRKTTYGLDQARRHAPPVHESAVGLSRASLPASGPARSRQGHPVLEFRRGGGSDIGSGVPAEVQGVDGRGRVLPEP